MENVWWMEPGSHRWSSPRKWTHVGKTPIHTIPNFTINRWYKLFPNRCLMTGFSHMKSQQMHASSVFGGFLSHRATPSGHPILGFSLYFQHPAIVGVPPFERLKGTTNPWRNPHFLHGSNEAPLHNSHPPATLPHRTSKPRAPPYAWGNVLSSAQMGWWSPVQSFNETYIYIYDYI